ncbi:competence/damage-inducible protein A [Massilia sp. TSP1-1-2]|uniref:competence/damage-inducible protein A n=1 Tax=unclassified Massilia TaxID=2609279 RepID=UPI003CEFBE57
MAIGLIIIGDEIMSGKRQDAHFSAVLKLLAERGLQLAWAEYLGDDPQRLSATFERTMATGDIVFSCGGIGSTPDDHTRQCAARALGRPLVLHPEGRRNIEERIIEMSEKAGVVPALDSPENQQRLQMAVFAQGATLIPNPFNKIAGFTLGTHHFVPGFPVMATPMIAWVLDNLYAHLFNQAPRSERSVIVFAKAESALVPLMEYIEATWPQVKAFSLPSVGDADTRAHIELGVKGEPAQTAAAFAHLRAALDQMQAEYRDVGT